MSVLSWAPMKSGADKASAKIVNTTCRAMSSVLESGTAAMRTPSAAKTPTAAKVKILGSMFTIVSRRLIARYSSRRGRIFSTWERAPCTTRDTKHSGQHLELRSNQMCKDSCECNQQEQLHFKTLHSNLTTCAKAYM